MQLLTAPSSDGFAATMMLVLVPLLFLLHDDWKGKP